MARQLSLSFALIAAVLVVLGGMTSGTQAQTLQASIAAKTAALGRLAAIAEAAHNDRCSLLGSCGSACSVPACGSDFPSNKGFHCNGTFGLDSSLCGSTCNGMVRSMQSSVVRIPPQTDFNDLSTQTFVCSTRNMDSEFSSQLRSRDLRAWQYIGHSSGAIRIFPGAPQARTATCDNYDARLRPWFIAASSGPKDIVIVIDNSGSMSQVNDQISANSATRMAVVKNAVDQILGTFTANDFIGVVRFSTDAAALGTPTPTGLLQGTAANIANLRDAVSLVSPDRDTNMAPGFTKAFDLLANSRESTSNCTRIILFLTDGAATDGSTIAASQTTIEAAIAAGQTRLEGVGNRQRAHIFTYSMSSQADNTIPRAVACANSGVWASISSGADPLSKMRGYFSFLSASISATEVRWTTPYEDAFGLGRMVTGARAIYDRTQGVNLVVGVVGADVTLAELQAHGDTTNEILNELINQGRQCPSISLSQCQLQLLRNQESYTCPSGPTVASCSTEVIAPIACSGSGSLNQYLCSGLNANTRIASSNARSLADVACCGSSCPASLLVGGGGGSTGGGGESSSNTGAIVGGIVGGIVVIIIIVVIAVLVTGKKKPGPANNNGRNTPPPPRNEAEYPAAPAPHNQHQYPPQQQYPQYPQYPPQGAQQGNPGYPAHPSDSGQGGHYPPPPSYGQASA